MKQTDSQLREEIEQIEFTTDRGNPVSMRIMVNDEGVDKLLQLFSTHMEEIIGEDEEKPLRGWFGVTQTEAYLTAKDRVITANQLKAEQRTRLSLLIKGGK